MPGKYQNTGNGPAARNNSNIPVSPQFAELQARSANRQKKNRRPKWQRVLRRYWPPIRFGLLCLLLVLVLFFAIKFVVSLFPGGKNNDDPKETTASTTLPPETLSQEEIQENIDALLIQADSMAAGYDYLGAIELIKSSEYFDPANADMSSKIAHYETEDAKLVSYPNMNQITHVFFHSLIVDTARAFDGDYTEKGYNLYMTTIDEFNKILEHMYERGYVLVSPYDVAYEVTDETGTHFTYGDIRLPEGKIPFIMSQDDVNYYGYMIGDVDPEYIRPASPHPEGDGFAHKLVIGEDGYPTCEYMDAQGNITTGDYDLVPILEKFIQEHPDFSYHGARAVLGMTGYEGVFGYRTKPSYEQELGSEAFRKEIEQAKEVAQCLRDHGWILASHSYGHPSYGEISAEKVAADVQKWEDTVESVIGKCDIILYPNGSDVAGTNKYTMDNEKFKAMYDSGLRYFFNVDSNVYWSQLGDTYYRGGRRNLDGYRMYNHPHLLDDLFPVEEVFDKARPTPISF